MTYYSEDPYLSHYGVKGMKWGVHRSRETSLAGQSLTSRRVKREIKKDAKAQQKALGVFGISPSTKRYRNQLDTVKAKDAELPGYRKAVTKKRQELREAKQKRMLIGYTSAFALSYLAIMNPELAKVLGDGALQVAKAAPGMAKLSYNMIKESYSTAKKGREFAESMGLDAPTYIDEAGKVLKNVRPNF